MIPWLLVLELMSHRDKTLSELVGVMLDSYPSPGEINQTIESPLDAICRVRAHYEESAWSIDDTDGLSMEFSDWRFNLRMSNTEPMVRLNVESRENPELSERRKDEILLLLCRL